MKSTLKVSAPEPRAPDIEMAFMQLVDAFGAWFTSRTRDAITVNRYLILCILTSVILSIAGLVLFVIGFRDTVLIYIPNRALASALSGISLLLASFLLFRFAYQRQRSKKSIL